MKFQTCISALKASLADTIKPRALRRSFRWIVVPSVLVIAASTGSGCVVDASIEDSEGAAPLDAEAAVRVEQTQSGAICLSSVAGQYCGDDMIMGGSAETLYYCPGGDGAEAQVMSVCPAGCHVSPPGVHDYCEGSGDACQTSENCDNCVFYARCRNPSLPFGLFSYEDKVAIITTYVPQAGAVAVIDTGTWTGHVAYVESVNGSTINLSEGNWPLGSCGQRSGTMESLNITGFFM